eukprot:4792620-Alexandrium_andersonii.AAC.1
MVAEATLSWLTWTRCGRGLSRFTRQRRGRDFVEVRVPAVSRGHSQLFVGWIPRSSKGTFAPGVRQRGLSKEVETVGSVQ